MKNVMFLILIGMILFDFSWVYAATRQAREYQCPINGFPHMVVDGRRVKSSREVCETYRAAVVDALYQANASDIRLICQADYNFMDTTINVLKGTFRALAEE